MAKENLCEFGIVQKECYFCEQPNTILFDEHYTFCPNCSAIYTFSMIQSSNCEHVTPDKRVPCVDRRPSHIINEWVDGGLIRRPPGAEKAYIYESTYYDHQGLQLCSICRTKCLADGW